MFDSTSSDLVSPNTPSERSLVYIRDLTTGTTWLLTVSESGGPSAGGLSAAPTYVKDLPDGVTSLVSYNATGDNGGNGTSSLPRFQPNGSKIAFVSFANNLVSLDRDPDRDIFLASVVPSS